MSAWDVGFLAVDETRAEKIAFTRPYHSIEATFAVRAGSDLSEVGMTLTAPVSKC